MVPAVRRAGTIRRFIYCGVRDDVGGGGRGDWAAGGVTISLGFMPRPAIVFAETGGVVVEGFAPCALPADAGEAATRVNAVHTRRYLSNPSSKFCGIQQNLLNFAGDAHGLTVGVCLPYVLLTHVGVTKKLNRSILTSASSEISLAVDPPRPASRSIPRAMPRKGRWKAKPESAHDALS
ncbi:MAG TPA: hypothetical protein VKQ29_11190 [Aliidongia sp.]|nr:hypothetical protein [Aliidongia sp.]